MTAIMATENHSANGTLPAFLDEWANWAGLKRVHITFDVDWAPDYMLRHVLGILDRYDVGATFFATHETALLKEIAAQGRHEVGCHPNLSPNSSQGAGIDQVLNALTRWYPGAVGCRFHVLGFSYRDLMKLRPAGIRYDVSRLMYNTSHLQPAYHPDLNLTLVPYMWEDGICENAGDQVSIRSMMLDTPGLKVLNFHPMNIFINGPTAEARLRFIKAAGPLLDCPEAMARSYRQEGQSGAQMALEELLARIKRDGLRVQPLRELEEAFAQIRPGAR
jgi:hypothetical protein